MTHSELAKLQPADLRKIWALDEFVRIESAINEVEDYATKHQSLIQLKKALERRSHRVDIIVFGGASASVLLALLPVTVLNLNLIPSLFLGFSPLALAAIGGAIGIRACDKYDKVAKRVGFRLHSSRIPEMKENSSSKEVVSEPASADREAPLPPKVRKAHKNTSQLLNELTQAYGSSQDVVEAHTVSRLNESLTTSMELYLGFGQTHLTNGSDVTVRLLGQLHTLDAEIAALLEQHHQNKLSEFDAHQKFLQAHLPNAQH